MRLCPRCWGHHREEAESPASLQQTNDQFTLPRALASFLETLHSSGCRFKTTSFFQALPQLCWAWPLSHWKGQLPSQHVARLSLPHPSRRSHSAPDHRPLKLQSGLDAGALPPLPQWSVRRCGGRSAGVSPALCSLAEREEGAPAPGLPGPGSPRTSATPVTALAPFL